jgi:hypothetical protein
VVWTAPMTAVAHTAFPATSFNTYVRDNLLESAPAKATTQFSTFRVGQRINSIDQVAAAQIESNTAGVAQGAGSIASNPTAIAGIVESTIIATGTDTVLSNLIMGTRDDTLAGRPMFSLSNPDRIVIQKTALYDCGMIVEWDTATGGTMRVGYILANTTSPVSPLPTVGLAGAIKPAAFGPVMRMRGVLPLVKGDIIRLLVWHDNGSSCFLAPSPQYPLYFWVRALPQHGG